MPPVMPGQAPRTFGKRSFDPNGPGTRPGHRACWDGAQRAAGVRGDSEVTEGLWRVNLETIDGWTLRATADAEADKGPFARLLGNP